MARPWQIHCDSGQQPGWALQGTLFCRPANESLYARFMRRTCEKCHPVHSAVFLATTRCLEAFHLMPATDQASSGKHETTSNWPAYDTCYSMNSQPHFRPTDRASPAVSSRTCRLHSEVRYNWLLHLAIRRPLTVKPSRRVLPSHPSSMSNSPRSWRPHIEPKELKASTHAS